MRVRNADIYARLNLLYWFFLSFGKTSDPLVFSWYSVRVKRTINIFSIFFPRFSTKVQSLYKSFCV